MDKMERQRQIESDSVRDGCVRWCQNTEYLEAADTRPYRKLIGFAVFEGKPIFESKQDLEGSGKGLKKMHRIKLTEAAETFIGDETPEALDLFNPIYFPYQVDHRGRVYPVPALLNPQSDHIGRALIEFADGKPVGNNRGVYWLGA